MSSSRVPSTQFFAHGKRLGKAPRFHAFSDYNECAYTQGVLPDIDLGVGHIIASIMAAPGQPHEDSWTPNLLREIDAMVKGKFKGKGKGQQGYFRKNTHAGMQIPER